MRYWPGLLLTPTLLCAEDAAPPTVVITAPARDPGATALIDNGTALRDRPGIDAIRLGGHGLDPVLSGQSGDRVAVLLGGAQAAGACPNRMDPASSLVPQSFFAAVIAEPGLASLQQGPGGAAGSVRFERRALPTQGSEGAAALAYQDNGDQWAASGHGASAWAGLAVEARADAAQAVDYRDGDGQRVQSAFTSQAAGLSLGHQADDGPWSQRVDVDYLHAEEVAYAGAPMDAPLIDHLLASGLLRYAPDPQRHLDLRVSWSDVDHVMDNFSLRPVPVMGGMPRYMRTDADSQTLSTSATGTWEVADHRLRAGLRWIRNQRQARRRSGTDPSTPQTQSLMWPEVRSDHGQLYAEADLLPGQDRQLWAALRLEQHDQTARTADQTAAGDISPNDLYQRYYGQDASASDQNEALAVLLRYRQDLPLGSASHVFLGLSSTPRFPSTNERFLAGNHSLPGKRWIGNPGLGYERHQQIEAGLVCQADRFDSRLRLFWDEVDDWILRDRARGQAGIQLADGATIYRPVEARLRGGEWTGSYRIHAQWQVQADCTYVHGENTTDARPLAQIPPLQGSLTLRWLGTEYLSSDLRLRWAAEQERVDDDPSTGSGQDHGPSQAWAVLDWELQYQVDNGLSLSTGVRNLLDETYATHLNKSDLFAANDERINEPGRSIWFSAQARF